MGLSHEQILSLIKTHKTKGESQRQEYDKYISWYGSDFFPDETANAPSGAYVGDDDSGGRAGVTFETNYTYSFIDTMIANITPTTPAVTVNARKKEMKSAAKFREALVNDSLQRNKAHEKLWLLCSKAGVFGRAFMKVIWNDRRQMPIFRVIDPRYIFFDLSVEDWEDLRYLIEVTVLTKQDFEARVKRKGKKGYYDAAVAEKANFSGYPTWLRDHSKDSAMYQEASKDIFEWCTIYEVYDFSGEGKFYHFLEDSSEPLMEADLPFEHIRNPFHLLTFNENLVNIGGLSDVKLIASVQERLNELDTLELWHAQTSIPVLLVNSGLVDNAEALVSMLQNATEPGAIGRVEGKARTSLRDIIGSTPVPSLSPSFDKMRDRATQVIEFTLGIPQYSRGQVGVADVATEVALSDAATRTRNGRRQKRVYDVIAWMAEAIVALYEELMPESSTLPVRLLNSRDLMDVTRESMGMVQGKAPDEPQLLWDYTAIPYSSVENNRLMQLKNIRENWDILAQGVALGTVDAAKLLDRILDLLMIPDVMTDEVSPGAGAQALGQMQPQEGMVPGQPGAMPGQDVMATGALPPGLELPMPGGPLAGGPGDGGSILGPSISMAKQIPGVQPGAYRATG